MSEPTPRFNLGVIDSLMFRVDPANELGVDGLYAAQGLLTNSLHKAISAHPHAPEEGIPDDAATYLVEQDFTRFMQHRVDPRTGPGSWHQRFRDPRVVRALGSDGRLVAYSHSVNNTSGWLVRTKMAMPPGKAVPIVGDRKYVRVSELAVDSDYWGKGIGTVVLYQTLSLWSPKQQASAYIFPRECPETASSLEELGMQPTGEGPVRRYGEAGKETLLRRYAGRISAILRRIRALPGAPEAISIMNARTHNTVT
jgi:hypothetical protein